MRQVRRNLQPIYHQLRNSREGERKREKALSRHHPSPLTESQHTLPQNPIPVIRGLLVLDFWKKTGKQGETKSEYPVPTVSSCLPTLVPNPHLTLPQTWFHTLNARSTGLELREAALLHGVGEWSPGFSVGSSKKSCVHARNLKTVSVKRWFWCTVL